MLEESRELSVKSEIDLGLIDPRSLKGEAKTMLYFGEAVDKTIKRSYHLKPQTRIDPRTHQGPAHPFLSASSPTKSITNGIQDGLNSNLDSMSIDSTKSYNNNSSTIAGEGSGILEEDVSVQTSVVGTSLASSTESAHRFNFEGITFPLLDCERFIGSCWRAFYENAAEPLHHMDLCQLALPHHRIYPAIAQLSKRVTEAEVEEHFKYFKMTQYSSLSWIQFKEFCSFIFTPLMKSKMIECGVPIKHFQKARSQQNKSMLGESQSAPQLGEGEHGTIDWSVLPSEGHPYGQMLRKHRYTSCVDKEQIGMPYSEVQYSSASLELPGAGTSSATAQPHRGYVKVPVSMLHDTIVDQFKHLSRQNRRKDLPPIGHIKSLASVEAEHEASIESARLNSARNPNQIQADSSDASVNINGGLADHEHEDRTMSANMRRRKSTVKLNRFQLQEEQRKAKQLEMALAAKQAVKETVKKEVKDVFKANPITDQPSYCKPLMKQKVFELTHRQESYANKWFRMKAIRDKRFELKENREKTKEMMHALHKTVINSDRMDLQSALSSVNQSHKQTREYLHNKNKYTEDMSSWRRSVYHRQESLRKEVSARELRRAVGDALSLVEEDKQRDRFEKIANKPESSISRLSEHTSYHVEMPTDVLSKIKNAKRYTEYINAKKNAEQYIEQTISDRISRYNSARQTAIARAQSTGAPVSVNSIFGDLIFQADSESALAGVAATMSLAYSSTLSMADGSLTDFGDNSVVGGAMGSARGIGVGKSLGVATGGGGGNNSSGPSSPIGFYAHGESNAFLKELAEKEYLARKQIYEDDNHSHNDEEYANDNYVNYNKYANTATSAGANNAATSRTNSNKMYYNSNPTSNVNSNRLSDMDDDVASEASWKTDPRLAEMNLL